MSKYKKGDLVKVWSLQSFHDGGFINGQIGVISQDQAGDSVFVAVVRKFNGRYQLDTHYEVYAKQCEPAEAKVNDQDGYESACKALEQWRINLTK